MTFIEITETAIIWHAKDLPFAQIFWMIYVVDSLYCCAVIDILWQQEFIIMTCSNIHPLVSIVIPCYNADRWVRDAVHSCLLQTYERIEIIIIDDGSIDDSLKVVGSFGDRVVVEGGPNRGGNYARNRGFAISKGKYIQFLDADDFILPEKIEHQVRYLEVTEADAVYGDWRHQHHDASGRSYFGEVKFSGSQNDVLESLLAGWWVAPVAVLFTREAVHKAGGWDESLRAGQDRDFMISMALSGANIRYQAGCFSIYRRYGAVTVSTTNRVRWLESHEYLLRKAEMRLVETGQLSQRYKYALAQSYFSLSQVYFDFNGTKAERLLGTALELCPNFRAQKGHIYNMLAWLIGFSVVERLASRKRKMLTMVNHVKRLVLWLKQ